MFNVDVDVFIYYSTNHHQPRWFKTCPDPSLINYIRSWNDGSIERITLYHEEMTHYDLIISRSSSLARNGPVSDRLQYITTPCESTLNIGIEGIEISDLGLSQLTRTPVMHRLLTEKQQISPLVFPACPRGPGRPKKKREGSPKMSQKLVCSCLMTQSK